jgi:hypothetical protein
MPPSIMVAGISTGTGCQPASRPANGPDRATATDGARNTRPAADQDQSHPIDPHPRPHGWWHRGQPSKAAEDGDRTERDVEEEHPAQLSCSVRSPPINGPSAVPIFAIP